MSKNKSNVVELDIQIIKASVEQMPVIAQLYELYTYEMTNLVDFDINDDGYYRYKDLPLYWSDNTRYPYLVWVNKKLAGFVLIQKLFSIEPNAAVWDVAEFFIMRKFRNKGIGKYVAIKIWSQFQGLWQVRVWGNNKAAHVFWDAAISSFMKSPVQPSVQVSDEGQELFIYTFKFSNSKSHSPSNQAINVGGNRLAENVMFKIINITQDKLSDVISPSIGNATEQKIQQTLSEYQTHNCSLIGAFLNNILIGVIGIEIREEVCVIRHISVSAEYRMQHIATKLIMYVVHNCAIQSIIAETDDHAVEFYKKCRFQCESFDGQYGKRYHCIYRVDNQI